MQKVQRAVKRQGGMVLGVALQGDTIGALREFQTRHSAWYPIAIDTQNKFGKFIEGIPLTIVVDRKGIIREVHDGFDGAETVKLQNRYLKLLSGK